MTGYSLRNHGADKGFKASTCPQNKLRQRYVPGDIAWVKIHGSSWWPTQVVCEKSFAVKPKKKMKDGILVRLYGSYKYLYVNPLKFIEFENIVNQESINIKEEFQKALEKELPSVISRRNSYEKVSELKENPMADSHRVKMHNQTGSTENPKVVSPFPGSSFCEPYETRMEREERRDLKHVAAGFIEDDENETQISKPTGKARPDVSEANDKKQSETSSNKEERNGASKIRAKDQDILRRTPRNRAKEDKHVMKHATAGYIKKADKDEARKSRATEKVRADASGVNGENQGETDSKKQRNTIRKRQRNDFSRVKTKSQGRSRQLPCNNNKEEAMQDVNLNLSKIQTEEKQVEIPNLMQQGNAADSEIKDSKQHLAVPMTEENVTSAVSGQKHTKQSEMASLENGTPKFRGTKQVMLKKSKLNAHEEAKRLVILELAKHRGTVNRESETTELKERTGNGDVEVRESKQNGLIELKNKEVEEQRAEAMTDRFSKHKHFKRRKRERQSVNEDIYDASRGKIARPDSVSHSKRERLKNAQGPCTTSYHLPEETEDVSARKIRVMQSLGLVAPQGSPFCRKALVQA